MCLYDFQVKHDDVSTWLVDSSSKKWLFVVSITFVVITSVTAMCIQCWKSALRISHYCLFYCLSVYIFLFFHQQQNKEKEMKSRCLDSACGLCYLSMHIDRQWLSFFNRSIENQHVPGMCSVSDVWTVHKNLHFLSISWLKESWSTCSILLA